MNIAEMPDGNTAAAISVRRKRVKEMDSHAGTNQPRARVGGEYGPNGEWYEGGKFIATRADTIKTAPPVYVISDEERAHREAARLARAATAERLMLWLAARAEKFAGTLTVLEYVPKDHWGNPITGPETFYQSLARKLRANGSVSMKQAHYIAKCVHGRQSKRNAEQYDDLLYSLVEEFA